MILRDDQEWLTVARALSMLKTKFDPTTRRFTTQEEMWEHQVIQSSIQSLTAISDQYQASLASTKDEFDDQLCNADIPENELRREVDQSLDCTDESG